ncbi:N-acetylglucosamine-6-phosphate deacetylase [Solibacillus sp. FSL W7-1464]|uniref:N-acetylglucosamine-6-phosphate deacetylase n=1 Tax=Solibacillus sp. FSL W7-1464 TaxID=2921706 RepID=UPI0030F83FEB
MEKTWCIGPLQIVREQRIDEDCYAVIEGKKIVRFCKKNELPEQIDYVETKAAYKMMPGMIDQHIHGMSGADVMDGTESSLNTISTALAKYGVTTFLATTMTASETQIERVVQSIANTKNNVKGAKVAGIHLEGPFINPVQKGAQSDRFIIKPSVEIFDHLNASSQNEIKLITLAAELDEDLKLSTYLKNKGIVASIGHSDAKYAETKALLEQQLIQNATHFCNGMRPIHHREPGLQVALLQSECMLEIIADGFHIHPDMIRFIYDTIGEDRMILISDSMRATELADGIYDLGGQQVRVEEGLCKLVESDALAGSTLNLNRSRKNMKEWLGLSDMTLAKLTSINSAKLLGLFGSKGSIEIGKDADFYIVNENEDVILTVSEGEIIYEKKDGWM